MADEKKDYPKEFDLREEKGKAPEKAPDVNEQAYAPTEQTLKKLNELPWPEIKEELGISLESLLKNTRHYGTLEALAYGRFSEPLLFNIKRGHEQRHQECGTLRLYSYKNAAGQKEWGYEIHPVKYHYKLDDKGQIVKGANGEPLVEIDRNPLRATYDEATGKTVEESLTYKRHQLSQEQVRHLRLTGNLGEPFVTTGFNGETVRELLSCDPYNRHTLVAVRADAVRARYLSNPVASLKGGDTVTLTRDNVLALSDGDTVWTKSAKGKDCCLQYDAYLGKVRQVKSYEMCCREDIQKFIAEAKQKSEAKDQAQSAQNTPRVFRREK